MVKTLPFNADGVGSIPGQGAKITHASWPENIKQKRYCKKFNQDFKNGLHKKYIYFKKTVYQVSKWILTNKTPYKLDRSNH